MLCHLLKRAIRNSRLRRTCNSCALTPDVGADAIHHALSAGQPRSRYRAGKHAALLAALAAFLPDRLLDAVRFRITGMPTGFGSLETTERQEPIERAA